MGRPKKQIDRAVVEQLANRQASAPMIAAVVGCSTRTLKRRFGRHLPLWREAGKTRIITAQWEAMENGNITMAIFLGKQHLAQAERINAAVETNITVGDPTKAFVKDQALMGRGLQFEEELADATESDTIPFEPGANRIQGLEVPETPPTAPAGGNGTLDKSGQEPDHC